MHEAQGAAWYTPCSEAGGVEVVALPSTKGGVYLVSYLANKFFMFASEDGCVLLGRGGMERNPPSNQFVVCLIVLILTVLDTDQIVNLVVSVIFFLPTDAL